MDNTEDWSLEEHLEELRQRLLWSILALFPALTLGFYLTPKAILLLENLAPKGTTFFQLKPGELFFVYFKLAFLLGLLFIMPFWLKQTHDFIWPGLKLREKKIAGTVFWGGPILFLIGLAFAYFVALKPLLAFILGFGVDLALVKPQYSLDYFISLVLSILLVFGVAFQIPIVLFILALLDLMTSSQMASYWKQAVFGAFIIAAVATPTPDPLNMSILGLALAALYGFSLLIIKLIGK